VDYDERFSVLTNHQSFAAGTHPDQIMVGQAISNTTGCV
jgi:hypothetical protein